MRILLIEDDRALAAALCYRLRREGMEAVPETDGAAGYETLKRSDAPFDLIILDRMLPGIDGVTLLARARSAGISTPVLMLTAMDAVRDRVAGLDAGADDYLVKPFAMDELLARVRSLNRRKVPWSPGNTERAADLTLDLDSLTLECAERSVPLSATEAKLLSLLMRNAGQTLTRGVIMSRVWGGADADEGSIDTYIHFVRKRLREARSRASIQTVRGSGYRLERGK
ncbi:MAG: response regulator transcription factor [Oscillospiraceae bacterium]|nr:response regulator transcription factor [Oscillospiraceae bacterium]